MKKPTTKAGKQAKVTLPLPVDVASRKALATRTPAPLSRVLSQAKASEAWRNRPSSSSMSVMGMKKK